jgi:hypothetical protein
MWITFNTDSYTDTSPVKQRLKAKRLIFLLRNLMDHGQFDGGVYPDIERHMTVPSLALKYVSFVTREKGMSPEGERIFLKNPDVAIKYLKIVKRDFLDPAVQKRWHKKVIRNPILAVEYCKLKGRRLSEREEEVFLKDMDAMKDYAMFVIRGPFPERIHEMILLRSFDEMKGRNSREQERQKRCLQDYLRYAKACEVA